MHSSFSQVDVRFGHEIWKILNIRERERVSVDEMRISLWGGKPLYKQRSSHGAVLEALSTLTLAYAAVLAGVTPRIIGNFAEIRSPVQKCGTCGLCGKGRFSPVMRPTCKVAVVCHTRLECNAFCQFEYFFLIRSSFLNGRGPYNGHGAEAQFLE